MSGITRFKTAQDKAWPRITRELATCRKETHWMWFVFPQLRGLAKSETAYYYGIRDKAEALAYLDDPVLRLRLGQAATAVLKHPRSMFTDVDQRKLRACMTLFREVVTDTTLPDAVLGKFFGGELCPLTLEVLAGKTLPGRWTPQARPKQERIRKQGKDDMARYWEKQIAAARAAVAKSWTPPPDAGPMSHREIESYLKGFGLSARAVRQITDRWLDDQNAANQQGWESRDDEYYED